MSDATSLGEIRIDGVNDTQPQDSAIQNVMTNARKLLGSIITRPDAIDKPLAGESTPDAIEPVMRQTGELIGEITDEPIVIGEVAPDDTIEPVFMKALELINQIIEPMPHGFTKEDLLRLILNHVLELKEPYSTIDQVMEAARQLAFEITEQTAQDDNDNTVYQTMESAQQLAFEITKPPGSVDNDNTVDQTMEAARLLTVEIAEQTAQDDNDNTVYQTMESAQQLAFEITKQPGSVDNDNTVEQTMEAARQLALEITKQQELVKGTDTNSDNTIDKTLQQSVDLLKEILLPEEVFKLGPSWSLSGFKMNNPFANIKIFKDRETSEHIDINEYENNNENKINTHINGNTISRNVNGALTPIEHIWWEPPPKPPEGV